MLRVVSFGFALLCSAAGADPLSDMQGAWSGSGWARETPSGPKEALRCRLTNTYDARALALSVSGRCVAAGRKIALAGEIKGRAGSKQITGHWFNPDGLGSVRLSGVQRGDVIAFTFNAKKPETGRDLAQNVEWRVQETLLHLRSSDRSNPEVMMSEITFSR